VSAGVFLYFCFSSKNTCVCWCAYFCFSSKNTCVLPVGCCIFAFQAKMLAFAVFCYQQMIVACSLPACRWLLVACCLCFCFFKQKCLCPVAFLLAFAVFCYQQMIVACFLFNKLTRLPIVGCLLLVCVACIFAFSSKNTCVYAFSV